MTTAKPQHRAGLCRVFLAAMVCAFGLFMSPPASAQMDSDFSAGGAVRIGDSATTCNAAATGALRYNSAGLSVSYCNGSAWTVIGTGQSFLSLSDTPASYAGAAGYFLKVNAATNAVEFTNQLVTSGTGATPVGMLLDNLDDVIITTPTNGQSLTYNGTNWVNSSGGGGAALSAITAATSTPAALANSTYIQTWNWALTAAAADAFTFGETTAATGGSGGQSILKATTLAASTAIPLMVTNLGNGLSLRVNDDTSDTDTTPFVVDASGQVGVGTAAPVTKLDVEGAVQIGDNSEVCSAATHVGAIRFNAGTFSICRDYLVGWEPLVGAGAGGACDSTQTYTTPGTYSYVVPPAFGVITIRLWGGGGGGGGASTGGSGGDNGANGGDTSILSRGLLATGGVGGQGVFTSPPGLGGSGGTASGGSINLNGNPGTAGVNGGTSGAGGNAPNGGSGGAGYGPGNGSGTAGTTPGGGGGGGNAFTNEAGGGGSGAFIEKTYTAASLSPGTTINDLVIGNRGTRGYSDTGFYGGFGGYGQIQVICTSGGNPTASGGDDQIAFFSGGGLTSTSTFVYTSAGHMGINTATPGAELDVSGTGAIIVPRGSTAQEPSSPVSGMLRYDTTTNKFRAYQNGGWTDMIGGGGGSIDGLSDGITDYVTDLNMSMGNTAGDSLLAGGQRNVFIGINAGTATTTGDDNTAIGYKVLEANTTGGGNVALGTYTLQLNTTGVSNTALGDEAMNANTSGISNVAVGTSALFTNTIGQYNTATGYYALLNNLDGSRNVAIGHSALLSNVKKTDSTAIGFKAMEFADSVAATSITYNTAVGAYALQGSATASANTGTDNTAVGHSAMRNMTSATDSAAFGSHALENLTTGQYNTALGRSALATVSTGQFNTGVGYSALLGNTGSYNTAVGYRTMRANISGEPNTAMGYMALDNATIANNNTAIGYMVANTNVAGSDLTAFGHEAMRYANSAAGAFTTYNTAIGAYALQGSATPASNTGTDNTAVGHSALKSATSGNYNTAVGSGALTAHTSGLYNTAVGANALSTSTTGNDNIGIGVNALNFTTTGGANVALGNNALYSNKGKIGNVAIGINAMEYADDTTSNVSANNVAIGWLALRGSATASANTGINNTAIGTDALSAATSGSNNTALGYQTGFAGTAITTGTNNTFIGYQAQSNANNYTNGTALGNGAILTASNRIVLGNASIASIYAQVTTLTGISDRRHKKDIEDIDLGLAFISKLKPVAYRFNNGDETLRYGFIAQDIEMALSPALQKMAETTDQEHGLALLSRENNDERTYRVNYGELTGPMVKAIQEQQAIIDTQRIRIEDQEARLDKLSKDLDSKMASFEKDLKGLKAHTGYDINKAGMEYWMLLLMAGLFGAFSATFVIGTVIRTRKV